MQINGDSDLIDLNTSWVTVSTQPKENVRKVKTFSCRRWQDFHSMMAFEKEHPTSLLKSVGQRYVNCVMTFDSVQI